MVAAAATAATTLELQPKPLSVTLFVGLEFDEIWDKPWPKQPRNKYLPTINIDGTVLTRVIHLEDAITEGLASLERCRYVHCADQRELLLTAKV